MMTLPRSQTEQVRQATRSALIVTGYTIAWLLLDRVTDIFETAPEVSLFYAASALTFVLPLVFGKVYVLAIGLPVLLDIVVIPPHRLSPLVGLVFALLTTIVYGGASVLLMHLGVEPNLRRFRDTLRFVFVATLLAPLLFAILGVTTLAVAGAIDWSSWGLHILHVWVGDSIGIASVAPFSLVWIAPAMRAWQRHKWRQLRVAGFVLLRLLMESTTLLICLWLAFGVRIQGYPNFSYIGFLPMIWLTVRYGLPGATITTLLLNLGAGYIEAFQTRPPEIGFALAQVQFYMLALSQTALLLGSTITRRFQAFQRMQQQADRAELLSRIGRSLNSQLHPSSVLAEIVRLTGEGLRVDRVVIWNICAEQIQVIQEWRSNLRVPEMLGVQLPLAAWFRIANPDAETWQHSSLQIVDLQAQSLPDADVELVRRSQIRSLLRVPLFVRNEFFGHLSLHTTSEPRIFACEEIEFVEQIAEQAAIALHSARSYEYLERLIQERTQALSEQQQLAEAANQAKSEFLANMSHELRTPLTSILGFSTVLVQQLFGPLNPKQQQYIETILSSGEHLLELINDVLDLSRIEAGREELNLEEILVSELCESCIVLLQERARNRGLELVLNVAPEVTTCIGDRRRLRQILMNLLSNAIKFTETGSIRLNVSRSNRETQFAVIDTGSGISKADQARLFQPFEQIGNATQQGSGLGLALSQRLAQIHGGEITLESAIDQGSCFTLHLPDLPLSQ
ncbi:MASE1 domain-containing protein [Microcoleus sp. FACHB-1515]|uniref:ATP-binding protein n=1 Tax=Cyanophyceae TaxID=3028117 RepID=UPI001684C986|nr:ATP-binding protein [Microcoleus sp. FACHB-1515]MBD2090749.1 MASE1 domain-containing protein [Microcoleus sp. FACHB-1515]